MATAKSLPQESSVKANKRKRKLPPGVVERNGRWFVVVRFREGGKRHSAWRRCEKNPTHAKEVRTALKRELEDRGPRSLKSSQMTWLQLSQHFRNHYLQPAAFVGDRLVSGYRSIIPVEAALKPLDAHFAHKPIRSITRGDLITLKRIRLQTPVVVEKWQANDKKKRAVKVKIKKQRAISTVNKELRQARHLFNIAVGEGWLLQSPFNKNDKLISEADETKCERVLSLEEETLLLTACIGAREHLRPRIICALDTGMRRGEMNKLRIMDLDFDSRTITIKATHTKTLTARRVIMTERVVDELLALSAGKTGEDPVFGSASVKKAWTTLREQVGLSDVRWHDLRHTNATRIEKSKRVSAGQLQRHLGHADRRSTERYVNQDDEAVMEIADVLQEAAAKAKAIHDADMIRRANEALDRMHEEREKAETVH